MHRRFRFCLILLPGVLLLDGPAFGQGSVAAITAADLSQPANFPSDPSATADHQELANYAWRLFIAASQKAGASRGVADGSSTFVSTGSPSAPAGPLVWETFYHRTEAYPYYDTSKGPSAKPKPGSSTAQLPTYYFQPNPSTSGNAFVVKGQWNNLDENNQIGQNTIYFPKGIPHLDNPAMDSQILFQAKVNANELNYVFPMAPQPSFNFTFPTSPAPGTIEIKSAWRLASDIPSQDLKRYHVAPATYYTGSENNPQAATADFALLSLHIIIKTPNHPTFIFSTFEQIDSLYDSKGSPTGVYYIPSYYDGGLQYLPAGSSQSPSATYRGAYTTIKPSSLMSDSTTTTALPPGGNVPQYTTVIQPKTITAEVISVNQHVHGLLPSDSRWRYYALKGVQSLATNTTGTGSSRKGNPTSPDYYLANIVVESSQPGVQLFQGGAPGPNTVNGKTALQPQRGMNNVTAPDGTKVNLGGCSGCHGVAQGQGTDFSFLGKGVGNSSNGNPRTPGFGPDLLGETLTIQQIRVKTAASPRKVQ